MQEWILPTISEVLSLSEESGEEKCCSSTGGHLLPSENRFSSPKTEFAPKNTADALFVQAESKWRVAIAALEQLLLQDLDLNPLHSESLGLIFSGPAPVLSHKALSSLPKWIFRPEPLNSRARMQFQLPPAAMSAIPNSSCGAVGSNTGAILTLLPGDPLATEQFCLVLTTKFSIVMVLGKDLTGSPTFLFSFAPEVVEQAWRSLQTRVSLTSPHLVSQLDALVKQYYPVVPDYQTVTQFGRLLLKHISVAAEASPRKSEEKRAGKENNESSLTRLANSHSHRKALKNHAELSDRAIHHNGAEESYLLPITINSPPRPDIELIQAFAHEVRTPLTTIRTLTRLLLKRRELPLDISNRLKIIDRECTEQIDRMELLFQAAELQSTAKHSTTHLTAISLSQVLQQSIPRWQSSASRRNLTLDVALPQQLPTVVSDPTILDRVLTGLIENFTRSLPPGSHIQVEVIPAGDQLKLQLLPQTQPGESNAALEQFSDPPVGKSIGPLLMFQPETGIISLNLTATKHLFQAIGGKLIVRQRPHQGEVLTIFLPLEVNNQVASSKSQVNNQVASRK